MNRIRTSIPSLLTLANLAFGFFAMVSGSAEWGMYFVLIAAVMDIFDGLVARALKAQSDFGKELDSLADIVSFGVAPAVLLYRFFPFTSEVYTYPLVILPVFAAIRLARFNIDQSQAKVFRGLPSPAAGLFFASIPVFATTSPFPFHDQTLLILILLFAYLMVSPIRMFAFKNIKSGGADMIFPLVFLGLLLAGAIFLRFDTVTYGVVLYILMSLLFHSIKSQSKR